MFVAYYKTLYYVDQTAPFCLWYYAFHFCPSYKQHLRVIFHISFSLMEEYFIMRKDGYKRILETSAVQLTSAQDRLPKNRTNIVVEPLWELQIVHLNQFVYILKKVVSPLQARMWPRGWVEVWPYSSMTAALEGGKWSAAHPGRALPPGKTRCPLYRRLGGPQGRSGRTENLSSTGIRSPDRPSRSQSLYRLSYRANTIWHSTPQMQHKVATPMQTAENIRTDIRYISFG
jgi:hypothetical protein